MKIINYSFKIENIDTSDYYEVIGVPESLIFHGSLPILENELNIDKREGFYICYPVKDSYGSYVYFDAPNKIVLCVCCGYWGENDSRRI